MTGSELPPGWYTSESGETRYWDGSAWLTRAAPQGEGSPAPPRAEKRKVRVWPIVAGALLLVVGTGMGWRLSQRAPDTAVGEPTSTEHGAEEEEANADAEAAAQASIQAGIEERARARELREAERAAADAAVEKRVFDLWMNNQTGFTWEVIESGNLYARWAELDEFHCGAYDCASVVVYTVLGCPSSLYVEASLVKAGTTVALANDTLGVIAPDSQGQVILEDYQSTGGDFVLTKVNCR